MLSINCGHYGKKIFGLFAENAKQLKGLSQQANWQIRQTPEYQRLTADFAQTQIRWQTNASTAISLAKPISRARRRIQIFPEIFPI